MQLPVEIEQNPVGVVKSVNTEKRLATFVVLEPQDDDGMTTDLHGDYYDEDTVVSCKVSSLVYTPAGDTVVAATP